MKFSKSLPLAAVVISSVFLAAAFTMGDRLLPSPVSAAIAEASTPETKSACHGQTWPHFTPDCLATMSRDTDQQSPQRVLTVLRTSY